MSLMLPIGSDNFGTFIEKNLDFVDKSLFIQEILDDYSTEAMVITRHVTFTFSGDAGQATESCRWE